MLKHCQCDLSLHLNPHKRFFKTSPIVFCVFPCQRSWRLKVQLRLLSSLFPNVVEHISIKALVHVEALLSHAHTTKEKEFCGVSYSDPWVWGVRQKCHITDVVDELILAQNQAHISQSAETAVHGTFPPGEEHAETQRIPHSFQADSGRNVFTSGNLRRQTVFIRDFI